MKKSMIALTIAFALVLSLCACGGQNSNTTSSKTLLEHGLDVIATMDEMADSDEYINFYTASKEMAEIVKDIGKGDHSAPTAVYKITIAKEAMDAWDMLGGLEGLSESLKTAMRQKAYAYGITGIDFISYSELFNGEWTEEDVLIDELEEFVKQYIDASIVGYSLTNED